MTPFDFEEITEPLDGGEEEVLDGGEEDSMLDDLREWRQEQRMMEVNVSLD